MRENIDIDVSAIITDSEPLETAASRLWDEMLKIAQGKITRCEVLQEDQLSVSRFGPSGNNKVVEVFDVAARGKLV